MHISLNGSNWLFKDFYGDDWRWRDVYKPGTRDVRWWRAGGRVPGSVIDDLWRLGELPDPYVGQNSLLCEWVPQRTWVYKKAFTVPEHAQRFAQARLIFEGVDYEADFYLNGEHLGSHRGMYTPVEFDVADRLRWGSDAGVGENLIAVAIAPAPHDQPQVGYTSRVRTHKARMNYWWDFCPRLVHQGIWDDVYLDFAPPVRVAGIFVRPLLNDDYTQAQVRVEVELAAAPSALDSEINLVFDVAYQGRIVAHAQQSARVLSARTTLHADLTLAHPHLWWPNGAGPQSLYTLSVRIADISASTEQAHEQESHKFDAMYSPGQTLHGEPTTVTFGLRRIALASNATPDPAARPYTFVVNGRPVYINGWNWVPIDALYGVPRPEKLRRLLTLAQAAHVNLLRVWGGGLIEQEAFYTLCDELGILVWQEFIQSSSGIDNAPSTAPDHIAMLTGEAERIIPRRRNHPSLALWCGGNELQGRPGMLSAPDVGREAHELPLDDDHPTLAALKAVVQRLDPDRLWLPTSPTGRAFGYGLENIAADPLGQHDVHGPWEYQGVTKQYTLYNAGTSLLHSEFGVEGITNAKTLNRVIPPDRQWPVDLAQNRDWFHLGAWWVRRVVWDEVFGPLPDVATYIRATQFTQAEGLRYALEADRRRQWRNSGTLPWQFNEPYPMAACTSSVDYWAEPKPVYYAVARAYAPLTVTAAFPTLCWAGREQFEAALWLTSAAQSQPEATGQLTARLIGASGRVYQEQTCAVNWLAGGARQAGMFAHPLAELAEDIFFLDLAVTAAGQTVASNRYPFTRTSNLAALMAPQPQTLLTVDYATSGDEWRVTIRNAGAHTAFFVWLEDARERGGQGWVYFDDNYFSLLPGEERAIAARWSGVAESERQLHIAGWNTL